MNNRPPVPANMPRQNPFQFLQQIQQNPVQMLKQFGLNVPDNLNDPNAIIQHLMNSGQITQERYEQARKMAARLRR